MAGAIVRRGAGTLVEDPRYARLWETAGPATGLRSISLAYVEVAPGRTSPRHFHRVTEEVYAIVAGQGVMWLDDVPFPVEAGDSVAIPPGVRHAIGAGPDGLGMWVATAPAYDEADDIEEEAP